MLNSNNFYLKGSLMALLLALAGCNDVDSNPHVYDPVAFHSGDECHICGMAITGFPGPKGEAVAKQGAMKFCSTAEMFGWWLQPENREQDVTLYVHDMARSTWEKPDDDALIDARQAFYVVGANLKGAMGAALASFAREEDAERFATSQGGRLVRFEQIDLALMQPDPQSHPAEPHGSPAAH